MGPKFVSNRLRCNKRLRRHSEKAMLNPARTTPTPMPIIAPLRAEFLIWFEFEDGVLLGSALIARLTLENAIK